MTVTEYLWCITFYKRVVFGHITITLNAYNLAKVIVGVLCFFHVFIAVTQRDEKMLVIIESQATAKVETIIHHRIGHKNIFNVGQASAV